MGNEEKTNHTNSFLLLIIIAILLFGTGVVLGFFKNLLIFLLVLFVLGIVLWIIFSLPRIGSEIVEDQKKAFKKRPTANIVFFVICGVFSLVLFIGVLDEKGRKSLGSNEAQSLSVPLNKGFSDDDSKCVKFQRLDYIKAKESGSSDTSIFKALDNFPCITLDNYPTRPIPTIRPECESTGSFQFQYRKARASGMTDDQIFKYLETRPCTHLASYP